MILKLRRERHHYYVEVSFFVGPDRDHLQLAGQVKLTSEECEAVANALAIGAVHVPDLTVIEEPPR